jgi:hypothetical protein
MKEINSGPEEPLPPPPPLSQDNQDIHRVKFENDHQLTSMFQIPR